jgi:hypothetical protein
MKLSINTLGLSAKEKSFLAVMRFAAVGLAAAATLTPLCRAQAPVYQITQQDSSINFSVSASTSGTRL